MIIGTAGHIDHGKTALVRALTGVDTDRLKEEKARGISIDLGFAYLAAPDGGVLGFVDVPGHEKFVHNMLAGATGIDFVLLAIAADDGVMPQTLEHLAIVDLLGIARGVVALTKADLAGPERRAQLDTEIANTLAGTGLAGAEIIPVSVVTGEGVGDLRACLFAAASALGARAAQGRFRLAVDRSFTLPGTGTVVTGTVLSGAVNVGDRVAVSPSGLSARVRSVHAQNRATERGEAGERCALNLAGDGIAKDTIARGDVVLDPDLHAPAARIDATLRVLASEQKPVTHWMPVRLHHAASDVAARVVLLGDAPVGPGTEACVQLVLDRPIAAAVNDRFVLRDTTAQRTIAGGRFLDLRAPARKCRTPERLAQLGAHAVAEAEPALAALLDRAPWYVDLAAFARDRALSASQIDAIVARGAVIRIAGNALGLSPATWLRLQRSLAAALEAFHADNPDLPGIGLERLRLQLQPRLPAPTFSLVLQGLARSHAVSLDGAWVRLPGHEVRLTPADEKLWASVQPLLEKTERFRPPRVRDIAGIVGAPETEVRRLLKLLSRIGKVDEVAHDHFFLRGTVAEMVAIAASIAAAAPKGEFTAALLRDRLDNGRKVAIQILEFFDRHGVTLRRGDVRRINRHRLDLFGAAGEQATQATSGREPSPVGRPDFKSGRGREPVLGGFDSLSLPPASRGCTVTGRPPEAAIVNQLPTPEGTLLRLRQVSETAAARINRMVAPLWYPGRAGTRRVNAPRGPALGDQGLTMQVHKGLAPRALGSVQSVTGSQANVRMHVASLPGADDIRATVGKFLGIHTGTSLIVGVITKIAVEPPGGPGAVNAGAYAIAQLDMLGEIKHEATRSYFQRGVTDYPMIGDAVDVITQAELRLIFDISGPGTVAVGHLQQDPTIPAYVNVDEMVRKHFAVFGTTGVGKSSGVALLVREILDARGDLRVFLIDPHNEYGHSFGPRAQVLSPNNLKLPFWLFNFEEIVDVFFRGRPGVEEEVEILSELLPLAKSMFTPARGLAERRSLRLDPKSMGVTVDTPVPYRLEDLIRLIDERMGKLENRAMWTKYHRLITRIETARNDPRYGFMFDNANVGGDTMVETLATLFRLPPNGMPMTIMQLAGFPAEVVDSVVSVLLRMAFEFGLWSDGAFPLLVVCEEAHRYAPADRSIGFGPTRKAVSRIAKEGRKYGVFLGLITQRPAELDATIISQCSTLFAMRMANDRDQAIVRSAVSDAAGSLLAFVPSLGTREVFAFGEGVALPTRLRFKELARDRIPHSEAVSRAHMDSARGVDVGFLLSVIERWRGATMSARARPDDMGDLDSIAGQEFSQLRAPAAVNQGHAAPPLAPAPKAGAVTPESFFFPVEGAPKPPFPRVRK